MMGLLDSRGLIGGLTGAVVLGLLRQATERGSAKSSLLVDAVAATTCFAVSGSSPRPVLAGAVLGACAGAGSAALQKRGNARAVLEDIALFATAGVTAGAVCQALRRDWAAEDFSEAFFP